MSSTDANMTYFASGYIGRSITQTRKCSDCKCLLLADSTQENEILLSNHLPVEYKQLFDTADRGRLCSL